MYIHYTYLVYPVDSSVHTQLFFISTLFYLGLPASIESEMAMTGREGATRREATPRRLLLVADVSRWRRRRRRCRRSHMDDRAHVNALTRRKSHASWPATGTLRFASSRVQSNAHLGLGARSGNARGADIPRPTGALAPPIASEHTTAERPIADEDRLQFHAFPPCSESDRTGRSEGQCILRSR